MTTDISNISNIDLTSMKFKLTDESWRHSNNRIFDDWMEFTLFLIVEEESYSSWATLEYRSSNWTCTIFDYVRELLAFGMIEEVA